MGEWDGMITSLIAGTAVPSWDTALVRALNDTIAGIWNESEIWHYEVVNDEGEAYRRLVVEGPYRSGQLTLNRPLQAASMVPTKQVRWTPCQTPSRPAAGVTMQS